MLFLCFNFLQKKDYSLPVLESSSLSLDAGLFSPKFLSPQAAPSRNTRCIIYHTVDATGVKINIKV